MKRLPPLRASIEAAVGNALGLSLLSSSEARTAEAFWGECQGSATQPYSCADMKTRFEHNGFDSGLVMRFGASGSDPSADRVPGVVDVTLASFGEQSGAEQAFTDSEDYFRTNFGAVLTPLPIPDDAPARLYGYVLGECRKFCQVGAVELSDNVRITVLTTLPPGAEPTIDSWQSVVVADAISALLPPADGRATFGSPTPFATP